MTEDGVLTLGQRSVRSIMTPRSSVSWVNLEHEPDVIRRQLLETPHGSFPVCRGSLDAFLGIGRGTDLIAELDQHGRIDASASVQPALIVTESDGVIELIAKPRKAPGQVALVIDEYGTIQGLVTPIDVFEAIAGEFPDDGETPAIQPLGEGRWKVDGGADLHHLEQALETSGLVSENDTYTSLAGYLLNCLGRLPAVDETVLHDGLEFRVESVTGHRIDSVTVTRQPKEANP